MAGLKTIGDFLTDEEIAAAIRLYRASPASFHGQCRDRIIKPNLDRINAALGQENDPDYLTYCVEFALIFNTENRNGNEARPE